MTAKIKLNAASGGGSVALEAPSSCSNNRVITLPDIADGTLLTNTKTALPLQVVQTVKKDIFSAANNSSFVEITGLNASITQASASNKVLVFIDVNCGRSGQTMIQFKIYDGSTEITAANAATGNSYQAFASEFFYSDQNGNYDMHNITKMFLYDGINDTNAHTIKVYGSVLDGSATLYVNRKGNTTNYNAISSITLMEVAG